MSYLLKRPATMRGEVLWLIGWLLFSAVSIGGFVTAFIPRGRPPRIVAVQIRLCPNGRRAAIHAIPEPPRFLENLSYLNVAVDHAPECKELRLKIDNSVDVYVLNRNMLGEQAKVANPSNEPTRPPSRLRTGKPCKDGFTNYTIDLTKLGADEWIGVERAIAGRRSSTLAAVFRAG